MQKIKFTINYFDFINFFKVFIEAISLCKNSNPQNFEKNPNFWEKSEKQAVGYAELALLKKV